MEKHTGFWTAFLLCLLMFCVGVAVLVLGKRFYVVRPPKGGIIVSAFRACWVGLVNKGKMGEFDSCHFHQSVPVCKVDKFHADAAKPSYQEAHGRKHKTPWNDHFVDELKRGLVACRVFVFYPIYWLVYGQMINNLTSQGSVSFLQIRQSVAEVNPAGTMELHGIPNDLMQNIDPLTIIIFIPIIDRLVYPGLRKIGIPFRPITRITMGFVFGKLDSLKKSKSILLMCVQRHCQWLTRPLRSI